jgi:hypothetical protein
MSLILGNWSVLYALGHHEYFARTNAHGTVAQLNRNMPDENQKEIIGVIVFVPNKFALDLHDHEVVPVEATDDARLPIF